MTLTNTLYVGIALCAVLALIWSIQYAIRVGRFTSCIAGSSTARLVLVQSLPLDPKRRLQLIKCDDRHVLVLTGGSQDLVLGWIEPGASR